MNSSTMDNTDSLNLTELIKTTNAQTELIKPIGLALLVIFFVIIVSGNISVLAALIRRKLKSQMRFFIINLASTDLLVAFGGVVPEIIMYITKDFHGTNGMCVCLKFVSTTSLYASSFALVVLSIDRAEAVCRPLRIASSKLDGKVKAYLLIFFAWLLAALFGAPSLFLARKENKHCKYDFGGINAKAYFTSVSLSVFILPACIITICHVTIVLYIWRASKLLTVPQTYNTTTTDVSKLSDVDENGTRNTWRKPGLLSIPKYTGHKRASTEGFLQRPCQPQLANTGYISKAKVKTVKMTCVIVSAYIICWSPFIIWNLLVTYGVISYSNMRLARYTPLIQHLVPLNSSANPIIFWIFNTKATSDTKGTVVNT